MSEAESDRTAPRHIGGSAALWLTAIFNFTVWIVCLLMPRGGFWIQYMLSFVMASQSLSVGVSIGLAKQLRRMVRLALTLGTLGFLLACFVQRGILIT